MSSWFLEQVWYLGLLKAKGLAALGCLGGNVLLEAGFSIFGLADDFFLHDFMLVLELEIRLDESLVFPLHAQQNAPLNLLVLHLFPQLQDLFLLAFRLHAQLCPLPLLQRGKFSQIFGELLLGLLYIEVLDFEVVAEYLELEILAKFCGEIGLEFLVALVDEICHFFIVFAVKAFNGEGFGWPAATAVDKGQLSFVFLILQLFGCLLRRKGSRRSPIFEASRFQEALRAKVILVIPFVPNFIEVGTLRTLAFVLLLRLFLFFPPFLTLLQEMQLISRQQSRCWALGVQNSVSFCRFLLETMFSLTLLSISKGRLGCSSGKSGWPVVGVFLFEICGAACCSSWFFLQFSGKLGWKAGFLLNCFFLKEKVMGELTNAERCSLESQALNWLWLSIGYFISNYNLAEHPILPQMVVKVALSGIQRNRTGMHQVSANQVDSIFNYYSHISVFD